MAIFFGAVAALFGAFAVVLNVLRHAPEGYQDKEGFHFTSHSPAGTDLDYQQSRPLAISSRRAA